MPFLKKGNMIYYKMNGKDYVYYGKLSCDASITEGKLLFDMPKGGTIERDIL